MKPIIDYKRCNGNGFCTLICPEVFQLDKNRNITIINAHPKLALNDKLKLAARTCPNEAISLELENEAENV